MGEGPAHASLMLAGEQPGDQEDLQGHVFVGPAGEVLNRALEAAGISRSEVYITNAVKHFKNVARGKRRLHQRPKRDEIEICNRWLMEELRLVAPKLAVALGGTAAVALIGRNVVIARERGTFHRGRHGGEVLVTTHPSFILRLPNAAARERELNSLVADLVIARERLAVLGAS
jgi:DNA polymerase